MKLAYVDLCGFRGYREAVRFEFAENFTVIDGRNGVGKSTFFDAIEFALTGTITKYLDAKASGESVDDYVWWNGDTTKTTQRYVEVGFWDGDKAHSIRRTPRDSPQLEVSQTTNQLIDLNRAPKGAIAQLCAATIIRDEHIARLSLDLKEGERFTLLRDAIGATDAEEWISRAQRLASAAAARVKSAQSEVDEANTALQNISRQIDQARSALPTAAIILDATTRLQTIAHTKELGETLAATARERVGSINMRIELLGDLRRRGQEIEQIRANLSQLRIAAGLAGDALKRAEEDFSSKARVLADAPISSELSRRARRLEQLVVSGRELGRHDGACPLCASKVDHEHFQQGMDAALALAKELDAEAVLRATQERDRDSANENLAQAQEQFRILAIRQNEAEDSVSDYERRCKDASLEGPEEGHIKKELSDLEVERAAIVDALRKLRRQVSAAYLHVL
jgi:chromosome segregation protein